VPLGGGRRKRTGIEKFWAKEREQALFAAVAGMVLLRAMKGTNTAEREVIVAFEIWEGGGGKRGKVWAKNSPSSINDGEKQAGESPLVSGQQINSWSTFIREKSCRSEALSRRKNCGSKGSGLLQRRKAICSTVSGGPRLRKTSTRK